MVSNRAQLKFYILSFIQMVDTTAFCSPAWQNGKLLDILRWLEENEYLKKPSMLDIYSIVPLSIKKHVSDRFNNCPKFCEWQGHDSPLGLTCLSAYIPSMTP